MATIRATQAGTWKAVIRRTGWPITVKTFRLKRDATDWARRTEDEMVRGVYMQRGPSERTTVAAALDRYLREVTPSKRPSTQETEQPRARVLQKYFGAYSLAAVTPELVAKFRDDRLAGGLDRYTRKHRPRAANTVRLELALLSHLFTMAIREWGMGLAYNPVLNVRKPSPGSGRCRRLAPDEEARLLAAVDRYSNPMMRWIVRIALETGMRSSEITSLRRKQVDLDRRVVRLVETKNTSSRTVPLSLAATALFKEALNHPIRPIDTDLVFFGEPGRDGKRRPYQFNVAWLDIKASLGLKDLHFHDLRHEAVSRFVEGGLSDQEVASISGHKSMQMLKRYTHLRSEDLVHRLDRIARKPKTHEEMGDREAVGN